MTNFSTLPQRSDSLLKIIARHLTADLYNCKENKLLDMEMTVASLRRLTEEAGLHILQVDTQVIEKGHFVVLLALKEGHLALHTYTELRYAAGDIFLCDANAEPETLFKGLRSFFKPEKIRTTFLKRGDFGKAKDMKPKIKSRVAPLRRIHNTGAKVIRLLARRNRKKNF